MVFHKFTSVDEYLEHAPKEYLAMLQQVRNTIKKAIPEAEEVISYNMPAYRYKGILVYFALSKNHVGYYPTPSGIEAFKTHLKEYKHAKGSVQFPLNKPLPLKLIADIAIYRFNEHKKKNETT